MLSCPFCEHQATCRHSCRLCPLQCPLRSLLVSRPRFSPPSRFRVGVGQLFLFYTFRLHPARFRDDMREGASAPGSHQKPASPVPALRVRRSVPAPPTTALSKLTPVPRPARRRATYRLQVRKTNSIPEGFRSVRGAENFLGNLHLFA